MARNTDRQKLSLFDPLVENRSEGDDAASDDRDSAGGEAASDAEERGPDAVPFFRHR